MKDVFIYDAVRTPRGKGRKDGALHEVSALNLATTVLNEIKNRNELDGHAVEDVILGNVTQVGEQGACLARTAVLASELDEAIPGLAINRFCASGPSSRVAVTGGSTMHQCWANPRDQIQRVLGNRDIHNRSYPRL